jgi:RecB family exonuclease
MKAYGLDAVPFAHAQMDQWRDALRGGVVFQHETGLTITGGVDDIWVTPENELIVVDYKATSKDAKIESLDEEWHDGYKRQLEIYQWLLRQNGFKVSNTGYWVYANASKNKEAFNGRLEFELTLIPYQGDDSWIEGTIRSIKACLDSDDLPGSSDDCDYCHYREMVAKKLIPFQEKAKKSARASQHATLGL